MIQADHLGPSGYLVFLSDFGHLEDVSVHQRALHHPYDIKRLSDIVPRHYSGDVSPVQRSPYKNHRTEHLWDLSHKQSLMQKGKSMYAILSKYALPFFLLFGSKVTLNPFLDANFALYRIQRQIGYSTNCNCILVFPILPTRGLGFSHFILAEDWFYPTD